MRVVSGLIIGAIFGTGILLSGMANPAKVLNFFDLFGSWDPSLLLVMGSALLTTFIGYRVLFAKMNKPIANPTFDIPSRKDIDAPLVFGSIVYGVGWGITGYCPGGAIPALGLGYKETLVFVLAMAVGIMAARAAQRIYSQTRAQKVA